jgi:ABC-type branched-subunit amino acid transport system substrate-binding protein
MKKLFLVFSMVALAIGLAGCVAESTTEAVTEAPTEAPTDAPTQAPTEAPTDAPTQAPTEAPTEAPTDAPTTGEQSTEMVAQGVTDTTILVGNTAAVTGAFAAVGVPFNDAIKAVFESINEAGGIGGRTIEFISYDDEFNAANGVTFTETLVEQDEVFALVGHFGTPTVGATLDYIQTQGVPMVYAATGINGLYF